METKLQIFKSPEFGEIRTAGTPDNPLFCLADICRVLSLEQVSRVKNRLREDGVTLIKVIDSLGRTQDATFINEQNLYKVIMRSDKPQAEPFQDWVCGEVLPSIRRTGGYIPTTPEMTEQEILARAMLITQKTIEQQKQRIADLQNQTALLQEKNGQQADHIRKNAPKVQFADAVGKSDDTISVDLMAKLLAQNGINIGEKRLFEWLRSHLYISDQKNSWNRPYQKWIERGIFRVETTTWKNPSTGTPHVTYTPRITTKGQAYFVKTFLKDQPVPIFGAMTQVQ